MTTSVKTAAAVSTGASALTAANHARAAGANDRVNVALIGSGGRGPIVAYGMAKEGARISHVCDLNPNRLERGRDMVQRAQDEKPRMLTDWRKVLNSDEVDAVIVATPDHWHALLTIEACRAGKDVYVEKPHSHNIWESRRMMDAAEKYDRVVQVGTQNRSAPYVRRARDYIQSGKLGDIPFVKVYNMKSGDPWKLGSPGECPDGFDWDEWVGAAPQRPYHQHIFRHGWLKFWDFSGGDLAGDGIHQLDLALMLMGDPGLPDSVRGIGGLYAYPEADAEVPDLQVANWDFGDFIMTGEETQYPRYMRKTTQTIRRTEELPYWTQNSTRIELYGEKLMMTVGRHGGGWVVQQPGGRAIKEEYGEVPDPHHFRNFLNCVRNREKPNADIRTLHPAMTAIHMANIAVRVGNAGLTYDTETGRFGNDDANSLIKRRYREPYRVPEEV